MMENKVGKVLEIIGIGEDFEQNLVCVGNSSEINTCKKLLHRNRKRRVKRKPTEWENFL